MDDVRGVHFIQTIDEAAECARWLSTRGTVATDTETHGLDPHRDPVRLVQLGDAHEAWVAPVEHERSWAGFIGDLLGRFDGRVVCHNLKFDERMLRRWLDVKLDPTRVDDTMLMSKVIEPLRSAALKSLAAQLVDPRARALDAQLDDAFKTSGFTWETVPVDFHMYWLYAGIDTILTYRVYERLEAELDATSRRAYELELQAALVCARLEDAGVLIDRDFTVQRHSQLIEYVANLGHFTMKNWGVSAGSNAQVIERLKDFGYSFEKRTKLGREALDKDVLEAIDHPLADAVLKRRQAQKVASTYLQNFITDSTYDGRIHPRINTSGARTGRMSMQNPNLQNLPRSNSDNPLGKAVRDCVVAQDDHVLLMCDFDQVELRLFTTFSRDIELTAAFGADDIFTEMCRQIFNDPTIQRNDSRRQLTKNAMYARIYGAGNAKFAVTAGVPLSEAERFNALLDLNYPGIRRFQQEIDREAQRRLRDEGVAYARSPLTGRRFVLDDERAVYKLTNYLVQGSAAEVLKLKLVELAQAGLQDYMRLPVHDEIILEVPRELLLGVAHTVHDVMNDADLFSIPITASVAVGHRWGSKADTTPDRVDDVLRRLDTEAAGA